MSTDDQKFPPRAWVHFWQTKRGNHHFVFHVKHHDGDVQYLSLAEAAAISNKRIKELEGEIDRLRDSNNALVIRCQDIRAEGSNYKREVREFELAIGWFMQDGDVDRLEQFMESRRQEKAKAKAAIT